MPDKLTIDKEFSSLCPPLQVEERCKLEADIDNNGCRDAIVVWGEDGKTILDGHNRYEICTALKTNFRTKQLKLKTREECVNWIIDNQLARRNLSEDKKRYLRGKRYEAEKAQGTRNDITCAQNGHKSRKPRADERLAEEYKVARNTIRRDAKYAKAIDTIEKNTSKKARDMILSGEAKVSQRDVLRLAEAPPQKQREAAKHRFENLDEVLPGNKPEPEPGKSRGVGVTRAHEAIGCLKRIPANDALRKRGLQIVADWIRQNK